MPFPKPVQGLVIRYSYLWRAEALRGQEEGVKDRPCAVILVTAIEEDREVVTVLPITHAPPGDLSLAVEVPARTKERLGLDASRSWVVLSEANSFVWPGPDLRSRNSGDAASVAYGLLPYGLIEDIKVTRHRGREGAARQGDQAHPSRQDCQSLRRPSPRRRRVRERECAMLDLRGAGRRAVTAP